MAPRRLHSAAFSFSRWRLIEYSSRLISLASLLFTSAAARPRSTLFQARFSVSHCKISTLLSPDRSSVHCGLTRYDIGGIDSSVTSFFKRDASADPRSEIFEGPNRLFAPRVRYFAGASMRQAWQVRVTAKPQLPRGKKVSARRSPIF